MQGLGIGRDLLVVLVAAIAGGMLARWLRLPVILGYLAGGIAVGPFGLGLVQETETINSLANIGVVLLLFAIGLEFSLKELLKMGRVAVLGGSFGGYSTLAGLTFHPELFACGVDLVGVANLITWMESIPPYWKPLLSLFISRVGDNRTEEGRSLLNKHSPLTYVDRICKPLLIGQGANDQRVRQAESDQVAQAMQAKNIPVTYLLYPDEGHGFARPENNLSFFAITEGFLAKHIGGRCEPVGKDCDGSSLQVLACAEDIPGLKHR